MKFLLLLMLTHILADAVFQNREMAKQKSESLYVLLLHIIRISIPVCLIGTLATGSLLQGVNLTIVNATIHGIIDWNIWNGYKFLVYKKIKQDAQLEANKGFNTEASIPHVIENKLFKFKNDKEYAEDPWFYTFIVGDQALHHMTYVVLCYTWGVL